MTTSSDDDTDSTGESDGHYDSDHDPDVDMCMEDDVCKTYGMDLDSDVDILSEGDHEEEEDPKEEDDVEEDEAEEDENEEEDEDEDDGKEPQTIAQGEMANSVADDVDTMVDDQPIILPDQGQQMWEHTSWRQPPVPSPWPQSPELRPPPCTPETHPLSGLQLMGLGTPQKPRQAVPTLRGDEAAGNTSDMDVNQTLVEQSAAGDCLPNVLLPDVPLPEAVPCGLIGREWTSSRDADKVMFVAFVLGKGSCLVHFRYSNQCISVIVYCTRCEDLTSPRVCSIYGFCIGFVLFIALWDIAHAPFLQLLACQECHCDGVGAQ